jgi:hypothetical protein
MSELSGRLTTPDGWPVAGGTLTAVDATGVQQGRASSREDGGFVLDGLAGGSYTVIAAGGGAPPPPPPHACMPRLGKRIYWRSFHGA